MPWRRFAVLAALVASLVAQEHSQYVPMRDGVRLAVDVYLPANRAADARHPALLELTRYWRSRIDAAGRPKDSREDLDRHFLAHGYAVVKIDVRGSGASFGWRAAEYGPEEILDGHAIVEWVSRQAWCDGNVGAYGTSYSGTTAELLTASNHPALKAVCVGWSDFDVYASPGRPYGLFCEQFIRQWSRVVAGLDRNEAGVAGAGVRPVADDVDGALLRAAIAEHERNVDVGDAVAAAEFRDTPIGAAGVPLAHCTSAHWRQDIEKSRVPMLVLASWFDSGTAAGALERLRDYANPQKLLILASNHGGGLHASPFAKGPRPGPPIPSETEQFEQRRQFFDRHLRGLANDVDRWPAVRWFHLGEERLVGGDVFPPPDSIVRTFHPDASGLLATVAGTAGIDEHVVDFGVSTGRANRWSTQMGTPVRLPDRERMDDRMCSWTSAPLAEDLHVIGTPVLHFRCAVDRDDGAVLAYLEDVDPEGRSRYVTEGGLRLLHRGKDGAAPTFRQADAQPVVAGQWLDGKIELHPTSMGFAKGHRIRLAIAGADRDTFARVPAGGELTIRFARGAGMMRLDLPTAAAPR
ncbi:MAG: CocE/NonD family hydrolase [Planctomycetes bacterium]|nr:CocE/NonD family hydrolase [Planctomycetota bacterium]